MWEIMYGILLHSIDLCTIHMQCPKLRVHPAPGVHISTAGFWRCAPSVCTFFELFIIAIYWEGSWSNFWVHSFRGSAPCECTNPKHNFGH